jgi:hypothetical protein
MIVPGGGISLDRTRWIGRRPKYLLPSKANIILEKNARGRRALEEHLAVGTK